MPENLKKNVEVKEETPAQDSIKTRSAALSGILAQLSSMSVEDMEKWHSDIAAMNKAGVPDGAAAQNQSSIQMKGSPVKEDIERVFEGSELSEDVRERVSTLIEFAVSNSLKVREIELEEEFENRLTEQVEAIREELVEKVDQYLSYAAEQWVEKNEVAIESTLKVDRADRLFDGLTKLMGECNLEIPESVDVVEGLEAEIADLKAKLDEQVKDNLALSEEVAANKAMTVFDEVAEGLTLIEKDQFKKLIEDIEISEDFDILKRKLTIIKESHFKKKSTSSEELVKGLTEASDINTNNENAETLNEKVDDNLDPLTRSYVNALDRGIPTYSRMPWSRNK